MAKLIDEPQKFNKVVLVSGDGDFKILTDYLIEKERFLKILFPNKKYASSLYKKLPTKYLEYVAHIKKKIERRKNR